MACWAGSFRLPDPAGWVSDSRRILVVPDRSALQGLCSSASFRHSFDLGNARWRGGTLPLFCFESLTADA
jgi:hypothetical protein